MEGLTNVKDINESITIGNGKSVQAMKLGDLKCEVDQIEGRKEVHSHILGCKACTRSLH